MLYRTFFQFKKDNVLDELIELFIKKGRWQRAYHEQSDYLHKFYWPEIILSDEECKPNKWNEGENSIERLGEYRLREKTDGQVVLFMPAIFRCSTDFLKEKYSGNLSIELKKACFEALCELVLIHEFVHWLVDVGISPLATQKFNELQKVSRNFGLGSEQKYTKQLKEFIYLDDDSVAYHEVFTEIFTNYYCNKIGGLHWELFLWLEPYQTWHYTAYKSLFAGSDRNDDIIKIEFEQLNQVFDMLNFTREFDFQCFNILKILSTDFSSSGIDNKCKKYFKKLILQLDSSCRCYDSVIEAFKLVHPDEHHG
jgi:hypothetical protein